MNFSPPLLHATFIKRIKRFTVEVKLSNGQVTTAHCPNTGSMKSCLSPGCSLYISPSTNRKRKLPYTCEITEPEHHDYVGINTHLTNHLVKEAITHGTIKQFAGYSEIHPEIKLAKWLSTSAHTNRRLDFYLSAHPHAPPVLCEVKNATLYDHEQQAVLFPDAPTTRGRAHLQALMEIAQQGLKSTLLFVINRHKGQVFKPADRIDPQYGNLLRTAHRHGVDIIAYRCQINPPNSITIHHQVDVDLS